MQCAYHPDREPVGACVNCGKLVCLECKVTLKGKIYCNHCLEIDNVLKNEEDNSTKVDEEMESQILDESILTQNTLVTMQNSDVIKLLLNSLTGIKATDKLLNVIVQSVLLCSGSINESWSSLTNENPMPAISNVAVRTEVLWVFLQMMDRFAFQTGGAKVRDKLQDAIVKKAIRKVIIDSFDINNAPKGFNPKRWADNLSKSAFEEFNLAMADYASCKRTGLDKSTDYLDRAEETILAKLASRIARLTDTELNLNLRIYIQETAALFLSKSNIKEITAKACV